MKMMTSIAPILFLALFATSASAEQFMWRDHQTGTKLVATGSTTTGGGSSSPVTPPQGPPLAIFFPTQGNIVVGKPVSIKPTILNAVGAVKFSLEGALPAGLTIEASTGKISGMVTEAKNTQVLITAVDSAGKVVSVYVTFTVVY